MPSTATDPSSSRHSAPAPWHEGWFAPLNLAAYITWLAVLLQCLDSAPWQSRPTATLLGFASLLAWLASYLLAHRWTRVRAASPRHLHLLVLSQVLWVLGATIAFRGGAPGVLMIVVASQVVAIWPLRQAIGILVLANLAQAAIWSLGLEWSRVALYLMPMIGFQTFAGLTIHYAVTAMRAREDLAHTHAELLATQRLLEDSARSGERLRLSRELHDVAGHKLTALRLNLRLLERDPGLAQREELRVCSQLAEELLGDIRGVVSELRKHEGIDLPAAVRTLAAQIPGVEFRVDIDPALRVSDVATAETLLRCTQEAITNALRHGRARRIEIQCRAGEGGVELRIGNDGAPLAALHEGNGLTGMRERLASLGGALQLRPREGGGAELLASVPAHG